MTLIEAVLFISVALGLIVGGIVFYQQASLSARVSEQTRVLSSVVTESVAMLRLNRDFDVMASIGPSNWFIDVGIVPEEYVAATAGPSGSFLRTAWDGELRFQVITNTAPAAGAAPGTFVLTWLNGIPVGACTRLATTDAEGRSSFGVPVFMQGFADGSGQLFATTQLPLAAAEAATSCAAADTDADGAVTLWIVYFADW